MKSMKLVALSLCFASATLSMAQTPANYRPAVYPQQQTTAGNAMLEESTNGDATEYFFRNDVIDAKFVKSADGRLTFGGSTAMDLEAGSEIFTVKFGDGNTVVNASAMRLVKVERKTLTADAKAIKGAEHFGGYGLEATFAHTYGGANVTIKWTAELRDGSHYLKTGVELSADKDVQMFAVVPMQYNVTQKGMRAVGDNRLRGRVLSNDKVFACLDTPTGINTVGNSETPTINPEDIVSQTKYTWAASQWTQVESGKVPQKVIEAGFNSPEVYKWEQQVDIAEAGTYSAELVYKTGNNGLSIQGVELDNGTMVVGDYHSGFSGTAKRDNTYTFDVEQPGTYTLRCYIETRTERINSTGEINTMLVRKKEEAGANTSVTPIQGLWSRNTTLEQGATWKVGSVVGLMAPEEGRRSVLAYLERERAVPWRPFPIYNSWYELNINRTNKNSYDSDNLKVEQTVDVIKQWKQQMFDKQGVSIKAFVWDDGWDKYGTWGFNAGFPNGFTEPDNVARQMCSGQGAWLGPCGGYDGAGTARQKYWTDQGMKCNLHNPEYYKVFVGACKRLCNDYDFRYFKFDGISQGLPTAYAPATYAGGEEDCEAIISVERDIRENIKPDIFFNTTVGTWASPLWLNISDAVWRQDADHSVRGNNPNTREQWITYRDDLVYQHFVQESPLMTINSMMTHGFILTNYGQPATVGMPRDYKSVLNELRCAFACGSGQVELYCDYALMNSIQKDTNDPSTAGALWKDMADLIKWQRANADVLPDIHWVGGDPYTTKENIYGWAAWNGNKAVLSLRNGNSSEQSYEFSLREALNIPTAAPTTTVTLSKPFADQANLSGLVVGEPINIDTRLTVTLPGSSVYMFDGVDDSGTLVPVSAITFEEDRVEVLAGRAVAPAYTIEPLAASDKTLTWTSDNADVATVSDGAITGKKPGTARITATATSGVTKTVTVTVLENLQHDLETLIDEAQADYDAHDVARYSDGIITLPSQFSSPFSDSQEGKSFDALLDNDGSTYWHSDWHHGDQTSRSHYLQVTLPEAEALEGTIQVEMMRRINGSNLQSTDIPLEFDVEVSSTGNDGDWISAGSLVLEKGSMAEPKVYDTFSVDSPCRYFRFWCTKTTNNRGYFHVGDFQLRRLEEEAPNTLHTTEAEALKAALEAARSLDTATAADIAALQQAYDAYKAVIGKAVVVLTGYELPIPNGVYEIQNAQSVQDRGYLVDCSTKTDGPSLAECHMATYEGKHPAARNSETTSSYWYVHEKDGKYYIVSLSALQADATPRFITPSSSVNRTQYVNTATPLQIKEVTKADWTFSVDGNTYKYMLIADGTNGTLLVSAACGSTTAEGAVRRDTNTQDGGAPWKFIRSNVSLTDNQLAIRAAAIRLIEADANIVRLTEFIDKAPSGETTISDINVVRDVILKK